MLLQMHFKCIAWEGLYIPLIWKDYNALIIKGIYIAILQIDMSLQNDIYCNIARDHI